MTKILCPKGKLDITGQEIGIQNPIFLQHVLNKNALLKIEKNKYNRALDNSVFAIEKETDEFVFIRLKKKVNVLAVPRKKDNIVLFTSKESHLSPEMDEAKGAIKILQTDCVLIKGSCKQSHEKFKPTRQVLFPRLPSVQDVMQSNFGNCFLLAGLNAILQDPDGPEYIQNLMHQDHKGVHVRLYNPKTLEPCIVFVPNQVLFQNNKVQFKHKAYWVHVMEQAYAMLAYKVQGGRTIQTIPSFAEMYGDGGHTHLALTVLTGKRPRDERVVKNNILKNVTDFLNNIKDEYSPFFEEPEASAPALALEGESSEQASRAIEDAAQEENMNLFCLNKLLKAKEASEPATLIAKTVPEIAVFNNISKFLLTEIAFPQDGCMDTWEDINSFKAMLRKKFPGVEYFLEDYFDRNCENIPADIGHGKYTTAQLDFVELLLKALDQKKLITAGTYFKEKTDNGLFSGHAYTVQGIYFSENDGHPLIHVYLRNPWKHTGKETRIFDEKTGLVNVQSKKTDSPVFAVELTDFCQKFSECTIGALPEFKKAQTPFERNKYKLAQKLVVHKTHLQSEMAKSQGFFNLNWIKKDKIKAINAMIYALTDQKNETKALKQVVQEIKNKHIMLTWGMFSRVRKILEEHQKQDAYLKDVKSNKL